jgi:hypothetical protein
MSTMVTLRLSCLVFMYFFVIICCAKNNGYPLHTENDVLSQSDTATIISYLGQTGMTAYGSFNVTFADLIKAKLLPATKNNPNCNDIQISSATGSLSLYATNSGCMAAISPIFIDTLNVFGYSLKHTGNHNFFGFMFIFQKQVYTHDFD